MPQHMSRHWKGSRLSIGNPKGKHGTLASTGFTLRLFGHLTTGGIGFSKPEVALSRVEMTQEMAESDQEQRRVDEFILEKIDSVSHLEALLLLWNSRPKQWSPDEIASRLYVDTKIA